MARRFFKKKRVVKRRGNRRRRAFIPRGVTILNNVPRIQKFRYADYFNLNSVAGLQASRVFRANSCFDPDQSGVGHQPLRWDQWSAMFGFYVVIGAKMTVKYLGGSQTSSAAVPAILGTMLVDEGSYASEWTNLVEQGRGKWRIVNQSQSRMTTSLTCNFSAKKFFNVAQVKDNVANLGAATDANPTRDAYFIVYQQPVDKTGNNSSNYAVMIDYIVLFSEPKNLGSS